MIVAKEDKKHLLASALKCDSGLLDVMPSAGVQNREPEAGFSELPPFPAATM
jgi:hypothetical protein